MYRSQTLQTLHYFARPHAGVPSAPLDVPAAWTRDTVGSWRDPLGADEVRALDEAVRASRAMPRTRDELPLPLPQLERWRRELTTGRGFVVFSGVPVDRWTEAQCERFFWALGLHLGVPGAQNPQGDLLGHVRDQGFDHQVDVRAYRTRTRIDFHCDTADVVGLLCLHRAREGGRSRIASSVAVVNEMLRERPDLVPELFEPFALDTKGEGGLNWFPIAPCRYANGQLMTFWHADYYRSVTRHGLQLSARRREAMDVFDAIADRLCVEMDLQPGDVQLLSNHVVVHGRGAFEDDPEAPRHLLRLWLSLEGGPRSKRAWLRLVGRLGWERVRQRVG